MTPAMTSPWEVSLGYVLVISSLMGLAWLFTVGLARGARCAAAEHDRRMARVRADYQRPFVPPTNVTALPPRRDHVRVPHSRSR